MIFDKVREIIAEQLDVDPKEITLETDLMRDLEADSLDAVEIIVAIEQEYGIEVPDDMAEEFKIVENIVNFIKEKANL
ncbi:MAG: acyl carrier protein [Firmicutes bacterium]|nr:acyl carrier protein [Bacillota bacterium]